MSTIYKAHFWNHGIHEFETIEQDFEGDFETIKEDYFRIVGDRLAWLKDEEGNVVLDCSEEAKEYALAIMSWNEPRERTQEKQS